MLRAVIVVLALGACTHAQAPTARRVGKALAIAGVSGLIATSVVNHWSSDHLQPFIVSFSLSSTLGIGMYAAGELSEPAAYSESIPQRNQRWARILTDRAHDYARDGRCFRVRHIETRVRVYDRILHDAVFMQDPAIQKCLEAPPPPQVPEPTADPAVEP